MAINEMTQIFVLTLVAAYLTLVVANGLQNITCKDTDKSDRLCPNSRGPKDDPDPADRAGQGIYAIIGVVPALIFIGIVTVCCCLLYRNRKKKGAVLNFTTVQPQPVTVYQQTPYNPQNTYMQPSLQPPYPGFVYSPDQTFQQTIDPSYYSVIIEQRRNNENGQLAEAPTEPPAYYQNSPYNQKMNANFPTN